MSASRTVLQRQIAMAGDLRSVVRTMRALAASNIGHYEAAVLALADYHGAVLQGLQLCLQKMAPDALPAGTNAARPGRQAVIVIGSDHGLVGPFNDVVVEEALRILPAGNPVPLLWAVGERTAARLADAGLAVSQVYEVPTSADRIGDLVGRIQIDLAAHGSAFDTMQLHVVYNRPLQPALYEPVGLRLLPLDGAWQASLSKTPWPGKALPEVLGDRLATLRALLREYLFISLFQACAESLASENASRLAAMQRADRNIGDLLESLRTQADRQRQAAIDAELFDVVAGYEAMNHAIQIPY